MFIIVLAANDYIISGYIVKLGPYRLLASITADFNIVRICSGTSLTNLSRGEHFFLVTISTPFTQFKFYPEGKSIIKYLVLHTLTDELIVSGDQKSFELVACLVSIIGFSKINLLVTYYLL